MCLCVRESVSAYERAIDREGGSERARERQRKRARAREREGESENVRQYNTIHSTIHECY